MAIAHYIHRINLEAKINCTDADLRAYVLQYLSAARPGITTALTHEILNYVSTNSRIYYSRPNARPTQNKTFICVPPIDDIAKRKTPISDEVQRARQAIGGPGAGRMPLRGPGDADARARAGHQFHDAEETLTVDDGRQRLVLGFDDHLVADDIA